MSIEYNLLLTCPSGLPSENKGKEELQKKWKIARQKCKEKWKLGIFFVKVLYIFVKVLRSDTYKKTNWPKEYTSILLPKKV